MQRLAERRTDSTFPWGKRDDGRLQPEPAGSAQHRISSKGCTTSCCRTFRAQLFNVGCDETFDIGLGQSQSRSQQRGRERVYLDFLLKIHAAVRQRGRTMMFWGDIILNQPQLLAELPRDVIALNWGYEANHPFDKETAAFRDAGVPFYVCPGTSSWCSISGRTDNASGESAQRRRERIEARRDWISHHRLGRLWASSIFAHQLARDCRGRGVLVVFGEES